MPMQKWLMLTSFILPFRDSDTHGGWLLCDFFDFCGFYDFYFHDVHDLDKVDEKLDIKIEYVN